MTNCAGCGEIDSLRFIFHEALTDLAKEQHANKGKSKETFSSLVQKYIPNHSLCCKMEYQCRVLPHFSGAIDQPISTTEKICTAFHAKELWQEYKEANGIKMEYGEKE